MFGRFLILTLVPFLLFASEEDRVEVLSDLFQVPSGVVADCVNVITGHYFLNETDIYVPGPNPITYQRFYNSGNHGKGSLCPCWDDDGSFIDDWMQLNWELLVERELLGKNFSLTQFSTTHLSKNLIHQGKKPDYVVLAKLKEDLIDVVSNKKIPMIEVLRLFSFKSLYEKSNNLTYGPPFEIVGLVNDKAKKIYAVKFEDLRFYLYDFDHYKYNKYYLDCLG